MYITQHLSFQDQLHLLTPIAQKKKKKKVVGTQSFNQSIAN